MRSALLVLFCLFLADLSWAESKIVQSHVINVELFDPTGVTKGATSLRVRVRDVDSNKRAQITLQRNKEEPKMWQGFFRIQFFKGDNTSRVLEFTSEEKKSYFVYYVREDNLDKVKLFFSAQELTKHMSQEKIVAKGEGLQQVALPSPEKIMKILSQEKKLVAEKVGGSIALEEQEAQRRKALLEEEAKLTELQKAKNRATAKDLAQKADLLYQKQDYEGAERLYSDALKLDPDSQDYLYRYGISLYKTRDYEKSLLNLSIAEVSSEQLLERDYYKSLNYLKLKENERALKGFLEIRDEDDKDISPTASFLAGNLQYQNQDFAGARKSMEYVLDKSTDPQMDQAAEEMLDQIDKMENFIASKKEKYRFTFFAGPVYDENVLNLASNNVATNVQALRATYGASALGIWHRTVNSDLGTQVSISDYYSTDTSLKADADLQAADPLEMTVSVPYHREFATGSRSINWELTPQVKSIHMSAGSGSRQELIRSYGLSTSLAAPLQQDFYLSGRLEGFSDTSYLSSSSGDNSQSASKLGLTLSPIKLLDLRGERSVSADLSYFLNNAEGKNYRYYRWGLGVAYGAPAMWNALGILRLDYSSQNYSEASTPRVDTIVTLSGSLSKNIKKNWSVLGTLQYSMANSDVDLYKYNKMMVMGIVTYSLSILEK